MLVAVVWLVLASMRVPVAADTALLPCFLLPGLLSARGPFAGRALLVFLRLACAVGPMVVVHARNPDYDSTVRGPGPPSWITDVPTRAQIWGQIAAIELVLLILVEIIAVAASWWIGRVTRVDSHQLRR